MLFATIPSIEIKCCTKYMGTEVHDKKTKKDIYLLCSHCLDKGFNPWLMYFLYEIRCFLSIITFHVGHGQTTKVLDTSTTISCVTVLMSSHNTWIAYELLTHPRHANCLEFLFLLLLLWELTSASC